MRNFSATPQTTQNGTLMQTCIPVESRWGRYGYVCAVKVTFRVGEMGQWLNTPVDLAEGPTLVPVLLCMAYHRL